MKLYDQKGLAEINKHKKLPLVLLIVFCALFAVVFVLSIVLSQYKTQTIFIVITSIILVLFTFAIIYFACRLKFLSNLSNEYKTILETEKKSYKGLVVGYDDRLITLPDGSKVKQVLINIDKQDRIFYLSQIFEDDIELNKVISFDVAFDYIVGYQYED